MDEQVAADRRIIESGILHPMRLKMTPDEIGNVCLLLFFGNLAFIPILIPNTGGALTVHGQMAQMHGVDHIVILIAWACIACFLLKARFRLTLNLTAARMALLYCATLLVPLLWAKDTEAALAVGSEMAVSTIYAVFLITKFPAERLAVMIGWTVFILAFASAFFGAMLPRYGVDHFANNGAWQGTFNQKNSLGLVMAYGVAIALAIKPQVFIQRMWRLALFFVCLALVALSQSREAWIVCAVLFVVHLFFQIQSRFATRSRGTVLMLCLSVSLFVVGLVAAYWAILLKFLGRDPTMSGRTVLWSAVLQECQGHLLIGHSQSGFWGTAAANRVYGIVGWIPTSAHNGFLECLLDYGLLSLVPLCLIFLLAIRNAIKLLSKASNYDGSRIWIYFILVITIFNMTQTTTGFPNSISWLLLVGSACILEQHEKAALRARASQTWGPPMLAMVSRAS
jgi:exopolysaccharide production protein ExoQ